MILHQAAGAVDARIAGLHYATDRDPGIVRRPAGRGFTYAAPNGTPIDHATKARIRTLVIPPAWTDVWIARDPAAHLQATGRDARGRKQYRYHEQWLAVRDAGKYDHMLSRRWVLATVIRVLEATVIRVGNDEYRRGQRLLRTHHAPHAPRARARIDAHVELPREERRSAVHRDPRPPSGPSGAAMPGAPGTDAVSVP